MPNDQVPPSPSVEIDGLPYFVRMCEKIRLFAAGDLREDLHANLGRAMDLWACQFLGVDYESLKAQVVGGASNEDALAWARENGVARPDHERDWWIAYMRGCGFRDHLADKLQMRKEESGLGDRDDIQSMFEYIDADEGR